MVKNKQRKALTTGWAGVVDGEIYIKPNADPYLPISMSLFKGRAEARKHFDDVRRVAIVEVD